MIYIMNPRVARNDTGQDPISKRQKGKQVTKGNGSALLFPVFTTGKILFNVANKHLIKFTLF